MLNKNVHIIFVCLVIILGVAFISCKDDGDSCPGITSSADWNASKISTCSFEADKGVMAYIDYVIDTENVNAWNFDNIKAHCEEQAMDFPNACQQPSGCLPAKVTQDEKCTALYNTCTDDAAVLCALDKDENGTILYNRLPNSGFQLICEREPDLGMGGTMIENDEFLTCDLY
ncbi:hypothetical protein ACFL20_02965 [Spirochaetota bacterium]